MKHLLFTIVCLLILSFSALDVSGQILPRRVIESEEITNIKEDMRLLISENIFYLKKIDKDRRVVEFTYEDALVVEKYLITQPDVLICETDYLNKKFVLTARRTTRDNGFSLRKVTEALEGMGYVALGARSNTTYHTFKPKITTECDKLQAKVEKEAAERAQSLEEDDCEDCEKVRRAKSRKFDNMDYGGDIMIYDINSIPTSQAGVGSSNSSTSSPKEGEVKAEEEEDNK